MKVSIVIPVYNVEKYLEQCLNSAVNQTLKDIEIIAVNDGSTDESLNILQQYKDRFNNLVIVNKENNGAGAARNTGLECASGDYIYFLDSDDYILYNDVIEYCYNIAYDKNLDIITFDNVYMCDNNGELSQAWWIDNSRKEILKSRVIDGETFFCEAVKGNAYRHVVWLNLYRRDFLLENNFKFNEYILDEDLPFCMNAFIKASRVLYVPYQFHFYRIRYGSVSSLKIERKRIKATIENMNSMNNLYLENKIVIRLETKNLLLKVIKDFYQDAINYCNGMEIDENEKRLIIKEIQQAYYCLDIITGNER